MNHNYAQMSFPELIKNFSKILSEIGARFPDYDARSVFTDFIESQGIKRANENAHYFYPQVDKWNQVMLETHMRNMSEDGKDFVEMFINIDEKLLVAYTIDVFERGQRTAKQVKHSSVTFAINKAKLDNPTMKVKDIINTVAEKLSMTPRAVKKHYYLKK